MKKIIILLLCSVFMTIAEDIEIDLSDDNGYVINLEDKINTEELSTFFKKKFRESVIKQLGSKIYEEELRKILEDFREIVINGDPERGIPILDPYIDDELATNIVIPATGTINLDMKNVEITGLKDFIVDEINFVVLSLRLNYAFTIPELTIVADHYDLLGDIVGDFDLFGNGTMRMSALNTKIDGYAKLTIKNGFLYMNIFEISIDIDNFVSEVQGLMDDGDQCVFLNQVLQQLVPSVFITQRAAISEVIGEKVMEFANQYLTELTLADLIDLITGGGGL